MKPVKNLQMGKNGLSDAFVDQVRSIFDTERMVKISILKSACRDRDEARRIGEDLIGRLGPKFGFKLIGYVLTVSKFRKSQR